MLDNVLRQIAYGLNNKQIVAALNFRHDSVTPHVLHVFRKIGVTDRTQAALWAVRNGLV
jgi:DNA-binding NarL/FixJ family response regulator